MSSSEALLKDLHAKISPEGFEKLCERLLQQMGFDEIVRTGGSGDFGIDLRAVLRKSEIEGLETNTPFGIQAKCYDPEKTLNPSIIRQLRGSLQNGERGLLITTAKVSNHSTEREAIQDPSRLILVIDGGRLIELMKRHSVGIQVRYEIDQELLQSLESAEEAEASDSQEIVSKKLVSENDIKAKIIRIPGDIRATLTPGQSKIRIGIDGNESDFSIDQTLTYIEGVTDLLRTHRLLSEDDTPNPMYAVWSSESGKYSLGFERLDEELGTKALFKAAVSSRYPGAKRIGNTSTYFNGGKKTIIKYSRVYPDGIHYWFGIMEPDIKGLDSGEVESVDLLCIGRGFVVLKREFFSKNLPRLNVSNKVPNKMFHLHIEYYPSGSIQLILKDGERIDLNRS